ncbi:MAG: hypothetical protein SGBAC_009865 [Bacillariaceae sp.]
MSKRLLRLYTLCAIGLIVMLQIPSILAYREKDEETEDKELTAKLWELVDNLVRQDEMKQESRINNNNNDNANKQPQPQPRQLEEKEKEEDDETKDRIPFSERTKNGSIGYFSTTKTGKCKANDSSSSPEEKQVVCSTSSSSDSNDDDDSEDDSEDDIEECVDLRTDCEKIAQIGDCLYESDDCLKTCLVCRNTTTEEEDANDDHDDHDTKNMSFSIGRPQTMSKDFIQGVLEDIIDVRQEWEEDGGDLSVLNLEVAFESDDELLEAVALQILGTQKYMSEVVMEDPKYEDVRRSCQNYYSHCEIYASIGYCDNNFLGGEDFLTMRQKCAPACRTCDDYELLQPCLANFDHNFYHEGELDKLFRRMVGELDIPKEDLPYKPSVHARPGGQSKADYLDPDGTIAKSNEVVDGAWLITLEDFLTPEECDRMIELGALEGYSRSGLQAGKDKDNHRTSVNAWCSAKHCDKDPIAQKVVTRISNTTGMPTAYSEPLQLLKYTEGQYYKMHHDVDLPAELYWPQGPRVLTFFLYLNEVEEGGATRMVDITHNDDAAAPGEYQQDCLNNANSTEAKANCALIEMDIKPKRGMALVWPNLNNADMMHKEAGTWHEARPVIKGVKFGANAWFRLRRHHRDCDTKAYEDWLLSYNMSFGGEEDDDDDDDHEVLSMETLGGDANSTTTVESAKTNEEEDASTTITTTTTTVSMTPTTVTTTTTQVITTTTVTPIDEYESSENDSSDDSEDYE